MSVHLTYNGLFGNNLFQYVSARLFADDNALKLMSPWAHPDIVTMCPQKGGTESGSPRVSFCDDDDLFAARHSVGSYNLCGHYQRSRWYVTRRDEILKFCIPNVEMESNFDDIVMHVRLGDSHPAHWISPDWYLSILKTEQFRRLFIVTDDPKPEFMTCFRKYDPIIVSADKAGDWNLLRAFDRMIVSNSTYAWWAGFLSHASKIYTFSRWQDSPRFDLSGIQNGIPVDGKFWNETGGSHA